MLICIYFERAALIFIFIDLDKKNIFSVENTVSQLKIYIKSLYPNVLYHAEAIYQGGSLSGILDDNKTKFLMERMHLLESSYS